MAGDTTVSGYGTYTNPSFDPKSHFYIHPDYPRQIHANENLGDNNNAD